jgi:hypothetical protein
VAVSAPVKSVLRPAAPAAPPPELILRCESSIVQLQLEYDALLVSTLTRCMVLPLSALPPLVEHPEEMAARCVQVGAARSAHHHRQSRQRAQVGQKARNGRFGACFDPSSNGRQLLAARPGKRLWVADSSTGEVLSTLKCVVRAQMRSH